MKPSEGELAKHFSSMEDDVLLLEASNRLTLTDPARRALETEVDSRDLAMPDATNGQEIAETVLPLDQWVTLERFRDLSAGIVARSALEAAAIPCFLRDENTVRMDWQISNFIGGMRLQVREQDTQEAMAVLRGLTLDEQHTDEALEGDQCPHCNSFDIHRTLRFGLFSLAMVLFMNIPAPQGRRTWTCSACGSRWPDQEA